MAQDRVLLYSTPRSQQNLIYMTWKGGEVDNHEKAHFTTRMAQFVWIYTGEMGWYGKDKCMVANLESDYPYIDCRNLETSVYVADGECWTFQDDLLALQCICEYITRSKGKPVDVGKFAELCQRHPQLVEGLGYATPGEAPQERKLPLSPAMETALCSFRNLKFSDDDIVIRRPHISAHLPGVTLSMRVSDIQPHVTNVRFGDDHLAGRVFIYEAENWFREKILELKNSLSEMVERDS